MSKNADQAKNSSAQDAKLDAANTVPNRTIGFGVLAAIVVFVALFMSQQDPLLMSESSLTDAAPISTDSRFDAQHWYLPSDAAFGFVRIPAGTFVMGSNPALDRMAYENERWSSNQRQGSVELAEFYIAKFEVTNAQYGAYLADSNTASREEIINDLADHPVANITWPQALAYARWLEHKLVESDATPVVIKQLLEAGGSVTLPSEAQWEKAARGSDGRIFPWGALPRSGLANFSSSATVPVGSMACGDCANGLADMSGNVWELTRSPLRDYPFDEADHGIVSADDALWVMRGGSFSDEINNVRTAIRGGVDPGVRNNTIGFRVVISNP